MRILHSISQLDMRYGGPVRAVIDLSEAMTRRGHSVRVMSVAAPDAPPSWNAPDSNPRVVLAGPPRFRRTRFVGRGLREVREEIAASDVVHIHGLWTPYQTQVAREAHRGGVPYVVSCRGMLDDWCMEQKAFKKRLYLRFAGGSGMLNRAALVHCTAEGELTQSGKWFPGSEGRVIPNLLDLEPFGSMPGPDAAEKKFGPFPADEPTLLFLSRLHYKKGVEHLIRAAGILRDRGRPHRVLIAGTGDAAYERALRLLVAELGLEGRVAFLGMVVGDLKISLYQACDLFVLPTSQENFGFVLYEALAAGTPLVTTRGVDTWPELEKAGGVITNQDARGLADTIAALTSDRPALVERGEQGRQWVFRELDPARIAGLFEGMYADAAKSRG